MKTKSKKDWQDGMGVPPWHDNDDTESEHQGGWQDGMGVPPWHDNDDNDNDDDSGKYQ